MQKIFLLEDDTALGNGIGLALQNPTLQITHCRTLAEGQRLLEREGFEAPKFVMDKSVTDFYAFTKDSFKMENYRFHPFDFEIPMAI